MKFIVTGALGHIGSKVIRDLPQDFPNSEIVMIDDLSTQRYPSLFNLPNNAKYKFVEASVLESDLSEHFSGSDVVIHLAAITNAAASFEIKEKLEFENFNATKRVAEACVESNTAMIAISSTSVYGTQKDLVDEDCSIDDLNPQSPYAETKLKEEDLLNELSRMKGLKYISCRFGTIFGVSPGMRFHTAVNKFCWQAVMGLPITVWKTALHQKRPYLDLKDAVDAINFIIKNDLYNCRVFNVLTQNSTVNDIIQAISAFIPDLSIEFVDSPIMNQLSYSVANERFRNLGFEFSGSLDNGLKETIELISPAYSPQK